MKFKPFDYLAFVVATAVVIFFIAQAYTGAVESSEVRVQADGRDYLYNLNEDRVFTVSGPIGETEVEIAGGRVRVPDSPCRDKICVSVGWVSNPGEWIACLPNRVFVRVEGSESESAPVDAQTF
ncbi:MAG: NusG domain II-containing protein [Spirochaetaceae bacterium]